MNKFCLNNEISVDIIFEPPGMTECFFVFGLHKCGSSLMNAIFVELCTYLKVPAIAIPEIMFNEGILSSVWQECDSLNSLIADGDCFRGFRDFPIFLARNPFLEVRKKILLVRDPRDAIVSSYYSFIHSHTVPISGSLRDRIIDDRLQFSDMTIEDFALKQVDTVRNSFNLYHQALTRNHLLKIYRYEDIIFEKFNWIVDMLAFLEISLDHHLIKEIVEKHDIVPVSEDKSNHIRKVTPGDHLEKLSPECIVQLNISLADILERYSYPN